MQMRHQNTGTAVFALDPEWMPRDVVAVSDHGL